MCDYSLESFARRDAATGDQLKTARIGGHGSVGLVASDAPNVAVCLRPGTRLIVSGIPTLLQRYWNVGEVAIATFQQREAADATGTWRHSSTYRDGVRFDGAGPQIILFQDFPAGIELSVEMLPEISQGKASEQAEPELLLV